MFEQGELRGLAHPRDFVDEDRAPLGLVEHRGKRVGRGARAGDLEEGSARHGGEQVHDLGHLGRADARLARDECIGHRACHGAGIVAHLFRQGRGAAQQARGGIACLDLRLERTVFQHQRPGLERLFHDGEQIGGRAGLFEKVEGPRGHAAHGGRNVTFAGQQDHGEFGVGGVGKFEQRKAILAGHANVADDHARKARHDVILGLDIAARKHGDQVGQFKRLSQRLAHRSVIVYEKHPTGHAATSSPAGTSSTVKIAPPSGWFPPRIAPPKLWTSP